jgi:hypothetical protein
MEIGKGLAGHLIGVQPQNLGAKDLGAAGALGSALRRLLIAQQVVASSAGVRPIAKHNGGC